MSAMIELARWWRTQQRRDPSVAGCWPMPYLESLSTWERGRCHPPNSTCFVLNCLHSPPTFLRDPPSCLLSSSFDHHKVLQVASALPLANQRCAVSSAPHHVYVTHALQPVLLPPPDTCRHCCITHPLISSPKPQTFSPSAPSRVREGKAQDAAHAGI